MNVRLIDRLLICYISGMDLRRIDNNYAPFIAESFNLYPWAKINTIPETDLEPTLFTGVYPNEHGMWQVGLKDSLNSSLGLKLLNKIPDIITTTAQCIIHLFTRSFDLVAIPSWRRSRFEIYKTKHKPKNVREFLKINGVDTIFSAVGENNCNYIHSQKFDDLSILLTNLFSYDYTLELLKIDSLDTFQHWNLDNPSKVQGLYRKFDRFVEALHNKCQNKGTTMLLMTDHGHEPVIGSINIVEQLKKIGIPRDEYTHYIEVPKARFWFHSDLARERIVEMLSSIQNGTVLSYKDLHKYNVKFDDKKFGEYYFIANPGYILFPDDFYHPLGNLFLGLTDWQQRSRLFNPEYRGSHGYLPHNESEKGFMMIFDDQFKVLHDEVEIIDFAPTVLKILGYPTPNFMKGKYAFE
ncbi:MAG: alkaline phosphatase family protein [Thermodesulfobacteriota bacterium]